MPRKPVVVKKVSQPGIRIAPIDSRTIKRSKKVSQPKFVLPNIWVENPIPDPKLVTYTDKLIRKSTRNILPSASFAESALLLDALKKRKTNIIVVNGSMNGQKPAASAPKASIDSD